MEIVLAIILLFGGFTLGSISTDKGDDDIQSTMAIPKAGSVADLQQITQAMRHGDPTRCHSDRAIIYRDLTLPYQDQVGRQDSFVSDRGIKHPDE